MKVSWKWYIIPTIIFIICVFVQLVLFVITAVRIETGFQRFTVPGEHKITFKKKGTYIVYHEYQSFFEDKTYSNVMNASDDLSISIKHGNQELELLPYQDKKSYEFYTLGKYWKGISIKEVKITEPGEYLLTAKYNGAKKEPKIVLSVSRHIFEQMLPALVVMFCLSPFIVLAVALDLVIFYLRYKEKRLQGKSHILTKIFR